MPVRILFLADTHLGFDLPVRPRVDRPRRGDDFEANYYRALAPAFEGRADCVVHGGDLLYRSRVRQQLVFRALEPLRALADRGLPVFIVPGNHERSAIPFPLLASHPNIHIFSRPRTVVVEANGIRLAVAGFPQVRDSVRERFRALVEETGWRRAKGDGAILCMHQAVEGATVGPSEFVFRYGADVVPGRLIPKGPVAVLSGHIHRAQVLLRDLAGRPLPAPVLYPGSIERTSFAERNEVKGYLTLEIAGGRDGGLRMQNLAFQELPARPMARVRIGAVPEWERVLAQWLRELPENSVVQVEVEPDGGVPPGLSAAGLRRLAPAGMIVSLQGSSTALDSA